MKFSLFYEMQTSNPSRTEEAQLFHDAVDQAVLADKLGYHAIWAVEHHGLREYAHSSAPEIFLSFVAARTKRIRIGHGVTLLPSRYNHPIRVAERIATLDILSEGRVNFGTGKSASQTELLAFESDLTTIHDQWLEALSIIPRMWREDVFSFKGRFFDIPPTQIIPKPVQAPHPPVFAACSRPDTSIFAGKLGLGALSFSFDNQFALAAKVKDYRRAIQAVRPVTEVVTNHFACTPATLVLKDDDEACRYGFRGVRFFNESWSSYYNTMNRPVGPLPIHRDFLDEADFAAMKKVRDTPGANMNMVIGTPSHARDMVSRFVDCGVDELILIMNLGMIPSPLIVRSLKTFAEKVMPHFG